VVARLLKGRSARRSYSTCSSEVEWEAVVHSAEVLAVDQVRICQCYPFLLPHALLAGVFTASFGPGGFRTARMGGEGGARRQGGQEAQSSMLVQLLPLIILVAFSLLNALPSLLSGPSYPDPIYTFAPTSSYGTERSTSNLGIKYYVNEAQLNSHPVIGAELSQAALGQGTKSGKAMRLFEQAVEQKYTSQVGSYLIC
jgi:DnaJ homolog subfamily B member 12